MGCLIILILLGFPRLALLALGVFGHGYLGRAIDSRMILIAGFFFMPLTTIAFAFATNSLDPAGQVSDLGWVVIVVAGLLDLGLIGGGARARRRHSG